MAIPYGRQEITDEDISEVVRVLKSDFLTQGPEIEKFEHNFSEYIGSKYAVAVANGTAALHLSVLALGLSKGEKVITTPITFAASANAVLYAGGEVIFADIYEDRLTIDLNKVEALLKKDIKSQIKGIIPVDFSGFPVNLEDLRFLADKYGQWILEDACHAPGAYFEDSKNQKQNCGNGFYADAAIFSFHPVKHIATGEGGMITTNREDIYKKLLLLRTHGITKDASSFVAATASDGLWYYEMQELGYNYRLSDIQAALGSSQLQRAKQNLQKRRIQAQKYKDALADLPLILPFQQSGFKHAWHLYVIRSGQRLALYNHLRSKDIFAQVHYIPVHLLPYYRQFGWKQGDFPIAEQYYDEALSIPVFPSMLEAEQDFVIETIRDFLQ